MRLDLVLLYGLLGSAYAAKINDVRCPRSGLITRAQIQRAINNERERFFGNAPEGPPGGVKRQPYPGAGTDLREVNVNRIVRAVFSLTNNGNGFTFRGVHEHPAGLSNGAIRCPNAAIAPDNNNQATPTPSATPNATPTPDNNSRPAAAATPAPNNSPPANNNPPPPANNNPPPPANNNPPPARPAGGRGRGRGGRGRRSEIEVES